MLLHSINPFDNTVLNSFEEHAQDAVQRKLERAAEIFHYYSVLPFSERAARMLQVAEILLNNKQQFGRIMTLEMGKPILQSYAEIEKCAWVCRYYAENAETFLRDESILSDASKSYAACRPLGVILAIMPWNFPFWQIFRFAAPTLMAGNTILLKHASNVSGCADVIKKIFLNAGFEPGVFDRVYIRGSETMSIIRNPLVKAVSLTGSTAAGKAVAAAAGTCLKKCVLELGGSDPYVVLKDADLPSAVDACVTSRLINGGQSCISAKRFIIEEPVYDEFRNRFIDAFTNKKSGDPNVPETDLGPLARFDLRDELHNQVQKSIAEGAKLLLGGEIAEGTGAFYPPTILGDVTESMTAFKEELFGPVAPLIRAENEEHALVLANNSPFGLGAAVFTSDIQKGEIIAKSGLNAGSCFVNAFVKSDPRLPFGGINESGYGRELSLYGIREFVNLKTVYIK